MTTPFKASFCSLNARGLNQARKRQQLFRWLHNYKFDVIFLKGNDSTQNVEAIWESEWRGNIIYSHGTNHSKGVAIGHVRYINILTWLRGFRVKIVNFLSFFCLSIPKRDLDTKKATPNIDV